MPFFQIRLTNQYTTNISTRAEKSCARLRSVHGAGTGLRNLGPRGEHEGVWKMLYLPQCGIDVISRKSPNPPKMATSEQGTTHHPGHQIGSLNNNKKTTKQKKY